MGSGVTVRVAPISGANNVGRELTDDLVPLVDVVGAGEEHPSPDHLAHDAAHRPDVHVLLVAHAQDHLLQVQVSHSREQGCHFGLFQSQKLETFLEKKLFFSAKIVTKS